MTKFRTCSGASSGNNNQANDNIFIGEFELRNITEAPRGIPEILVSFNIDLNGIITVTATEKESNSSSSIIVNSNKGRLSRQDILKLIEEAKELEIRDELEELADVTGRTKSFLAAEAIASYLAAQAWQIKAVEKAVKKETQCGFS